MPTRVYGQMLPQLDDGNQVGVLWRAVWCVHQGCNIFSPFDSESPHSESIIGNDITFDKDFTERTHCGSILFQCISVGLTGGAMCPQCPKGLREQSTPVPQSLHRTPERDGPQGHQADFWDPSKEPWHHFCSVPGGLIEWVKVIHVCRCHKWSIGSFLKAYQDSSTSLSRGIGWMTVEILRRTRSSTFPAQRCLPKQVCPAMLGFHPHLQLASNLDLWEQLCHHWALRTRSADYKSAGVHLTPFHHSVPVIQVCYLRVLSLRSNNSIMKRSRFHLFFQQEFECILYMRHLWG